jgi:hypothetical protein
MADRRIMVGGDGTATSTGVLEGAALQAALSGRALVIVHG